MIISFVVPLSNSLQKDFGKMSLIYDLLPEVGATADDTSQDAQELRVQST